MSAKNLKNSGVTTDDGTACAIVKFAGEDVPATQFGAGFRVGFSKQSGGDSPQRHGDTEKTGGEDEEDQGQRASD